MLIVGKLQLFRREISKETKTIERLKTLPAKFFEVKWSLAYSLSVIGIFLLFYDIHLLFVRLLIINNIKTNKVIYDTSNIIKNADDAMATQKVIPFDHSFDFIVLLN